MRVLAWPGPAYKQQPYIYQLYDQLQQQGVEVSNFKPLRTFRERFDVWHMHWPENRLMDPNPLWAAAMTTRLLAEMQAARARGTKIIWTAHNLKQHEGRHPHMEPLFWQSFVRLLDGWIALSASGKRLAETKFPVLKTKPCFIVPLGHYRGHYEDTVSRSEARTKLGLSQTAQVVGFVGQIRAYKNVPHLVRTFCELPGDDRALLVVGRTKDAWLRDEIHAAAGGDPRVRLYLEFVPDDDLQLYLRASDLLALPYQDILNSSSALLALSFDVPVLVPARGSMDDLQRYTGNAWVQTFQGELSASHLTRALSWAEAPRAPLPLTDLNWDKLARQTLQAYQTVCSGVPQRVSGGSTTRIPAQPKWWSTEKAVASQRTFQTRRTQPSRPHVPDKH